MKCILKYQVRNRRIRVVSKKKKKKKCKKKKKFFFFIKKFNTMNRTIKM